MSITRISASVCDLQYTLSIQTNYYKGIRLREGHQKGHNDKILESAKLHLIIHVDVTLRMIFAQYEKENLDDPCPCYIRNGYTKLHGRVYHLKDLNSSLSHMYVKGNKEP